MSLYLFKNHNLNNTVSTLIQISPREIRDLLRIYVSFGKRD